jgi:opacity protein-like surface antigen
MGAKTLPTYCRPMSIAAAAMTVFSGAPVIAQTLRGEAAGGYAYLRDSGVSLPAGWFASVGASMNDWFGIVGDVSGSYRTEGDRFGSIEMRRYTFVAGPKFMYHANRLTPYVTLLVGGAHVSTKAVAVPAPRPFSDTRFAAQTGVGLDVDAMRNLGVRVGINEDYARVTDAWNKQFRFMTGIVAHW